MNQYIITEEQLQGYEKTRNRLYDINGEHYVTGFAVKIQSHPYQSERDRVLDILRPEVLTFALLMERNLRKHDKDRGDSYKTTDVDYLLMRLREEVKELHNAIEDDPWDGKGVSLGESVDVGNISMMIGYHDYQFPMDVFIEELVEELRQSEKAGGI